MVVATRASPNKRTSSTMEEPTSSAKKKKGELDRSILFLDKIDSLMEVAQYFELGMVEGDEEAQIFVHSKDKEKTFLVDEMTHDQMKKVAKWLKVDPKNRAHDPFLLRIIANFNGSCYMFFLILLLTTMLEEGLG